MGTCASDPVYAEQDLARYREKIQLGLEALARMLAGGCFSAGPEQVGLELELNLIDENVDPAMANQTVLKRIDDPSFQTELGQHMIELNVAPRPLAGGEALDLERELRSVLNSANDAAGATGVGLVMIGMLPTLRPDHFDQRSMSCDSRYALLNKQILAARRAPIELDVEGVPLSGGQAERLRCIADSILPASGCTSVQLHLQVTPDDFAAHWNAAQALAGVQVAVAANSPFLLGRALWHETRIPLFEQSTDSRSPELRGRGSASGGSPRSLTCSRRTCATSRRCSHRSRMRIRWRCLLQAVHRRSRSYDCTTARSGVGTGRSMTSPMACRTCVSKTGFCPLGQRSLMSWPTPRSSSARCADSPNSTDRCGADCLSPWPGTTCMPGHGLAWTHN